MEVVNEKLVAPDAAPVWNAKTGIRWALLAFCALFWIIMFALLFV